MNRDQLERSLAQSDLDAVVCVSPENVFYLSDVAIQTQRTIPDRLALVVWPRGDQPTFIVCSWEEAQAKAESWIADIRSYVEFQVSPMQLLADVLRERGLAAGRLGLDMRGLASLDYLELRELVPSARIVDGTSVMARARMIKTAKEVERLREAAEVTDRVIRDVFSPIAEGMTECEVATRLKTHLLCAGADSIAFTIFAGGANSSITHPAASDYRLRRGDLIRTDFGGAFREYLSDLARTAVVGAPQQEHVAMYATLWEIHQALIAQMTPGTRASDLFHSTQRTRTPCSESPYRRDPPTKHGYLPRDQSYDARRVPVPSGGHGGCWAGAPGDFVPNGGLATPAHHRIAHCRMQLGGEAKESWMSRCDRAE